MSDSAEHVECGLRGDVLVAAVQTPRLQDPELVYSLRDELIRQVDLHPDRKALIVDMQKIDFIASVGLLAFLSVRRHWPAGRIIFCSVAEPVRQMLILCRLIPADDRPTAPFEIAPNLELALQRCAK